MEVATLWPLDFRHRDRRGPQVTSDPSPVAAGSLYPGTPHSAEALSPTDQALVALRRRGHTQLAQASAKMVQGHRHVGVEVCVHAQGHLGLGIRSLGADHCHVRAAPFDVSRSLSTRRAGENGRYFYEKALFVKPTWRLRDRPRRTATIAPLQSYASIRTGVGPAFSGGPVHDGVRPDLKRRCNL